MKAKIVVGLGFGDEGKGITTDYLCSKYSDSVVVRYTGGHQAGHNVRIGEKEHLHSSYGSGTLRGIPSYLSEHCCFYPPNMQREYDVLLSKGVTPNLSIHPLAKLTTPYDVAYNRLCEVRFNHGSCGIGIGTTMSRNEGPYKLHAADILHGKLLEEKLKQIKKYYDSLLWQYNAKELRYYSEIVSMEFKFFYSVLANLKFKIASYDYLQRFRNAIFEGAQGILLDRDFGVFPNVTYGYTSSKNALEICNELGISDIDMFYVTRCYQTRHGNGWMSESKPINLKNERETNISNEWQGDFRVAELDYNLLNYALECDNTYSYGHDKHLIVTCLDHRDHDIDWWGMDYERLKTDFTTILESYSPDSKDFKNRFSYGIHKLTTS